MDQSTDESDMNNSYMKRHVPELLLEETREFYLRMEQRLSSEVTS